jgi:hypothetical protein
MTVQIGLQGLGFRRMLTGIRVALLLSFGIIALPTATLNAETTKTVYNPFTGKLDYITSLSTAATAGRFILNQSSLQPGASFYVTSGTVQGLFTVNGNIQTYGDTTFHRGSGFSLVGPNDLGSALISNINNSLSSIYINAVDGVSTNGFFSAQSLTSTYGVLATTVTASSMAATYGITASTITVSTITVTGQIKFSNRNCLETAPDGTCILSMPGVQETFFGYNTNILNNGGVFNTSYGAGSVPFPWSGNFNNCFGNSCMGNNLITGENNNGMGYGAMASLNAGFYNNAMGGSAMQSLTSGQGNVAVGAIAMGSVVSTNYSIGIGYRANFWSTGTANIGIGYEAGTSTDSANAVGDDDHMLFIGVESGKDRARGDTLTNAAAFGYRAYVHKSNTAQLGGQQGSGKEWTVLASTLSIANHYNNAGKISPVVSSCGATPSGSVVGYDSAGTITVGGGVVTSCTLTFATAWTNTPTCVISDNSTTVPGDISSVSATAVTFGFSTSLGGGKIYYICMGSDL